MEFKEEKNMIRLTLNKLPWLRGGMWSLWGPVRRLLMVIGWGEDVVGKEQRRRS